MSLELYLGPMFAGKSSAVLGVIRRNLIIGRPTLCLTSALDKRYTAEAKIVSHNKDSYPATAVDRLCPLLGTVDFQRAECIIVEEAQFFTDLRPFVLAAVEEFGKAVICVGLDGDSDRRPFGQLLDLVPYADKIHKFTALCRRCGDGTDALFTFRKAGAPSTQIAVGSQDTYEPLCRLHYLEATHDATIQQFVLREAAQPDTEAMLHLERCVSTFGVAEGTGVFEQILAEKGLLPAAR
jgi:thymidine kinase